MIKMIAASEGNRHDIDCPLCREKYGSTNGKGQEEVVPLALLDAMYGTEH